MAGGEGAGAAIEEAGVNAALPQGRLETPAIAVDDTDKRGGSTDDVDVLVVQEVDGDDEVDDAPTPWDESASSPTEEEVGAAHRVSSGIVINIMRNSTDETKARLGLAFKEVCLAESEAEAAAAAAAPAVDQTRKMAEDLGLDDEPEAGPGPNGDYDNGGYTNGDGDIDYTNAEDEEDEEDDGFSVLQFLGLKKQLQKVLHEQMNTKDDLKHVKRVLKETAHKLNRSEGTHKMQIGITMKLQEKQLDEYNSMIESLKLSVEELEVQVDGGENKSTGVGQLVETMQKMSDEKREFERQAKENQGFYNEAKEDLIQAELRHEEDMTSTRAEINALREKIGDVVAIDDAMRNASSSGASKAVVKAMQDQIDQLKNDLEIVTAQKTAAEKSQASGSGSGMTSEQGERYESELKAKKAMIARLETELKDSRATIAKLKAISEVGGPSAEETAANKVRSSEMTSMTKTLKEQEVQIDNLKQQLAMEAAANSAKKAELENFQGNMRRDMEKMAKMEGDGAAAQSTAQALEMDLSTTRQQLESSKAENEQLKSQVESLNTRVKEMASEVAESSANAETSVRENAERHASMLQKAKAEAAAHVAELNQRHEDDMKDMRARLGTFAGIVKPMMASYREVAGNYRQLRTEVNELAATVEPAVKQVKRDLLKTLSEVDKQYKEMLTKYRKEMTMRKKLHNQLVDLKGNIRVFCRLRPKIGEDGEGPQANFTIKEDTRDDQLCLYTDPKTRKNTTYDFTRTFGPKSTQQEVFSEARDLILSVIDGYNVCIFAYGQTGSGKTFTMEGSNENPGLNKRALASLFDVCAEKSEDWTYSFEVSVMEIYNETLRDLLNPDKKASTNKLEIKHAKSGSFVPGLIKERVHNQEEVEKFFNQAKKIRSTATTDMNEHSSRSHCLLVVYVQGTNLSTGVTTTGKLNLIDLAGSERVAKSGAIDDAKRMKEATSINKSLSALGDVIHALGEKQKHIPFRNSKLTHFLQDSLGGAAKTLMVVQISPVIKNAPESKCSLLFAERVKKVELGSAKKVSESAEMSALRKRVRELEAQV
mmetsp:Transcript_21051/g.62674  ORF Transcript_21051/g.62674 Transcript_21051/m.62674 type:complete len:1051 (+) Transcript_21051:57-3209(+)